MSKNQAVSYARFSSAKQGNGSSISRQKDLFNKWLQQNSDRYYQSSLSSTDEGISAFRGKNKEGGLGLILKAIGEGLIREGDALVVEAIDRLSRAETLDALGTVSTIVKAGVSIITLEDNQTYTRSSLNTSQIFLLAAKIQSAHEYSKRLGARVKSAWRIKESKARSGDELPKKLHNLPFWIDRETKKCNSNAEIVRELITLYLKGEGLREIAYYAKTTHNLDTSDRTIGRWLDNPALLGHWRGIKCFENLVTEDVFHEIQEQREKRKLTPKQPNFRTLSGLLRCSECGGTFNFRQQKPRPTSSAPIGSEEYKEKKPIVYGNCRNYLHKKSCSNGATVPEEIALYIYQKTVVSLIYDLAYASVLDLKSRSDYANLKKRRDLTAQMHTNHLSLYKRGITSGEEELESIDKLKSDLDLLDKAIADQEQKNALICNLRNAAENARFTLENADRINFSGILDFKENSNPEFTKQIEAEFKKLQEQPFLLRLALKNSQYRIDVSRTSENQIKLTCSESPDYWVIRRRSQLQSCYIVEHWSEEAIDTKLTSDEQGNPDYEFVNEWVCREVEVRR